MPDTVLVAGESRVAGELRAAGDGAEAAELSVVADGEDHARIAVFADHSFRAGQRAPQGASSLKTNSR